MDRRSLISKATALGIALCLPSLTGHLGPVRRTFAAGPPLAADKGSHPTDLNRPVTPRGALPENASFIDPTVQITDAQNVTLGKHVYVGPFARLLTGIAAGIRIGADSNVQDNVTIHGSFQRAAADEGRIEALKLHSGVEIGEQCILAHGVTVKGPAMIGVPAGAIISDQPEVPGVWLRGMERATGPESMNSGPHQSRSVFLSFGAEVDGAILEENTGLSALARVGPGVRLRSGYLVLPGKNVTTQEQADNPALGKVRQVSDADIAFNAAVLEVNIAFAREYSRLYYEAASSIRGINYNPGETPFNPGRHLPVLAPGRPSQVPEFRNRIIGAVYLSDSLEQLDTVMGQRISLRADEGAPIHVGHIRSMGDDVIFHALEHSDVSVGDRVQYGERVIVHGGERQIVGPGSVSDEVAPTYIADDVTLKAQAIVFRAGIGRGCSIGAKSAVINSLLAPGTVVPDRTIYLNDAIAGTVEW